jgi:hypothetical protein
MTIHLCGFMESQDAAGAYVNISALEDEVIYTTGDDLQIPDLNQVLAIAAGIPIGGNQLARLVSPSLRDVSRPHISPQNGGADGSAKPDADPKVMDLTNGPLLLVPTEKLNAEAHYDTTAAAYAWVLLWLSDGVPAPVAGSEIITVRGTNTDNLTAGAWTGAEIALDEDLPVGNYQVVGMRYIGAGAIAARLNFRTAGQVYRPGCLGCDSAQDNDFPLFRYGRLGVWGEFPSTNLPRVDFLSISPDTDQEIFLDLIKVS